MTGAKSWLGLVVAVSVAGAYAGCGGKHISSAGNVDTGAGGAGDLPVASSGGVGDVPGASAGSEAMAGGASSAQPTASCDDGDKNGDESDIDCGGVGLQGEPSAAGAGARPGPGSACPRCGTGQTCRVAADCSSIHCANLSCAAATCYDAIQNGDESDVDCGGPSCAPCLDAHYCDTDGDCASGKCDGGRRCIRPE